jgi:predicted DsbA family dithiol-disulfide isomerase
MAQGQKLGVTGTPGFLVNGVKVQGAREFEYFQSIIERWKKQLG